MKSMNASDTFGTRPGSLAPKIKPVNIIFIIFIVSLGVYFNALFNEFVHDESQF